MADTFLFVGTILVAFQIVGDIGYIAPLFSMPFSLPILPLLKRTGLSFKRTSRVKISFQIDRTIVKKREKSLSQVIWWILLILTAIVFAAVTVATMPITIAYTLIFRPLLGINTLMNFIYRKTMSSWDFMYLSFMQNYVDIMQKDFNIKTTQKKYSDKDLIKIRNKNEKDIPFVAFIGLLFIVAGFVLQIIQ